MIICKTQTFKRRVLTIRSKDYCTVTYLVTTWYFLFIPVFTTKIIFNHNL